MFIEQITLTAFQQHTGIPLERSLPTRLPLLSPEEELVIYRVVQEALTNVARHADARHAALTVEAAGDEVHVTVRDDGRGFDGPTPDEGGLRGMRERALLVRGSVTVRSELGSGTEIRLSVPVERAE